MNKALRKVVIAGNWKMNKTPAEAKELIAAIAPLVKDAACDVVACTPFVDLASAQEAAAGTNIQIGAENCHWEKSGAYTGEISAEMLASMGVKIVIIGHSERRQYFGETDVTVQKRVRAALDAGLTVILCVGETLEQREQGITSELVAMQTKIALGGGQVHERRAGDDFAAGVLYQGGDGGDELLGLGGGLVHLPVAGDDGFAQCFIHECSLLFRM